MKNNQKKVYLIAIVALILLIINGVYSTRIYNGISLKDNVLISLNSTEVEGVEIYQKSEFKSFESGFEFNLDIKNLSFPDDGVVSIAIPIKRLTPNTKYQATFKFKLNTNLNGEFKVKSNKNISIDQAIFETDVNFKPIALNEISDEYVVDFKFETNDEGVGYAIFDFELNSEYDSFNLTLSNVIFTDFKEIKDDNVNSEPASEISFEAIEEE